MTHINNDDMIQRKSCDNKWRLSHNSCQREIVFCPGNAVNIKVRQFALLAFQWQLHTAIGHVKVQTWTDTEGSGRLRITDLKTVVNGSGKVCHPYAPTAFMLQEIYLVLISVGSWVDLRAIVRSGRIMSINNSNGVIGNRTRKLPTYSCATAHQTRRHPYLSRLSFSCVLNIKAECFSILCQQVRLYLCALCESKKEEQLFILRIGNI